MSRAIKLFKNHRTIYSAIGSTLVMSLCNSPLMFKVIDFDLQYLQIKRLLLHYVNLRLGGERGRR